MSVSVIIPVTQYEIRLADTLESVLANLKTQETSEMIVVVNGFPGGIDNLARQIFDQEHFVGSNTECKIVYCEVPGKNPALNVGVRESRGDIIIESDGDSILAEGTIDWSVNALSETSVKAVSVHSGPRDTDIPKDKDLATIVIMNALRRHTFPETPYLYGSYMGWRRDLTIDGKSIFFPEGQKFYDDKWLTGVLLKEYGVESLRVSREHISRYIPPQNWEDYYNQQWRFQNALNDLDKPLPELADCIRAAIGARDEKYPEDWINSQWRESCISYGIDFDAVHPMYKAVLDRVRAEKEKGEWLMGENGAWVQQLTTKGF